MLISLPSFGYKIVSISYYNRKERFAMFVLCTALNWNPGDNISLVRQCCGQT